MNGRRNEYLDLILKILLDDSIIEQSNGNWWLISPWIQNNDRNYTHVGHFHSILPYTLNSTSEPFGKYCRSNYGLTNNEIYSMWLKYRNELWERYYKLSNNSINESVNRRNEYLDKIVQYIVDDSIIEINTVNNTYRGIIRLPFIHIGKQFSNLNRFLRNFFNFEGVYNYFYEYCEYNYGLKDDEIKYVWEQYKEILIKLSKKY